MNTLFPYFLEWSNESYSFYKHKNNKTKPTYDNGINANAINRRTYMYAAEVFFSN